MNWYWQNIADFWRARQDLILAAPRNEWAIGVYEWQSLIQMTPIEQWLWGDIRELNAVFYPQWPVLGMFVDFANPVAKVVLECDGAQYHQDKEKDAARDAKLEQNGWNVYRFSGTMCRRELDEEREERGWHAELAADRLRQICEFHGLYRDGRPTEGGLMGGIGRMLDHMIAVADAENAA